MLCESCLAALDRTVERYPALTCCHANIVAAVGVLANSFRSGGKLLVCGNGGSAADAQHIVGELMKGFALPRGLAADLKRSIRQHAPQAAEYLCDNLQSSLPAVPLGGAVGLATAFANDVAADLGFAQEVIGYGMPGDVLLAISTSGNSANVLYAAYVARAKGLGVIGLTGRDGGKLVDACDIAIVVPATETHEIQEYHLPIYHAMCIALEQEFFGTGGSTCRL